MEVYKDLNTPKNQQFEKLLNSQLSKNKIEEGTIVEGKITKITDKYVFIFINGLKSEPVIDTNEIKMIGIQDKISVGSTLSVFLERIEDKQGNVIVSAIKAQKIKGWEALVECHKNNELIDCKYIQKTKGGMIVEHVQTKTLCFLPGSQISDTPLKSVDHLIGEIHKFALVKMDFQRGNSVVSRRQVITNNKKGDKKKIIEQFSVGDIIKDARVKGYSSFGVFFEVDTNLGSLDVLVHLMEVSYSRVNHPDEIFSVGQKHDLKVISIDETKLQVGCSIKQLLPDPFEHISNYEIGKNYDVTCDKLTEYGAFCSLEPGLSTLLHNSEMSWTKKNVIPKKMFKVGQKIQVVITEIDKDKRRIAISHKLSLENPYQKLIDKFPEGSVVNGTISSTNEYALYIKIENFDIDGFCHTSDISWNDNSNDEIKNFKVGDKVKVKILEIKKDEKKVRGGMKQFESDPFDLFKEKKKMIL